MIDGLKVNQEAAPSGVPVDDVMFSWEATEERQFTVELCADAEYKRTVMYTDTRNTFVRYDGLPLRSGADYYWRVRTGIGVWSTAKFATAQAGA